MNERNRISCVNIMLASTDLFHKALRKWNFMVNFLCNGIVKFLLYFAIFLVFVLYSFSRWTNDRCTNRQTNTNTQTYTHLRQMQVVANWNVTVQRFLSYGQKSDFFSILLLLILVGLFWRKWTFMMLFDKVYFSISPARGLRIEWQMTSWEGQFNQCTQINWCWFQFLSKCVDFSEWTQWAFERINQWS